MVIVMLTVCTQQQQQQHRRRRRRRRWRKEQLCMIYYGMMAFKDLPFSRVNCLFRCNWSRLHTAYETTFWYSNFAFFCCREIESSSLGHKKKSRYVCNLRPFHPLYTKIQAAIGYINRKKCSKYNFQWSLQFRQQ